jgi:hypothetical protein
MNLTGAIQLRLEAIVVPIVAGTGGPSSPVDEVYIATEEECTVQLKGVSNMDGNKREDRLVSGGSIMLLSLMLIIFTLPHSIEDVLHGEPARFGMGTMTYAFGLALLYALQGLFLFWTGSGHRYGLHGHTLLGFGWGVSAIIVHTPEALAPGTYRSGFVSVGTLGGIALVGIALGITTAIGLRRRRDQP